jgi:spore germination protein KA
MQKKLANNLKLLKDTFGNTDELITKEIKVANTDCAIVYFIGISDSVSISKFVITPLLSVKNIVDMEQLSQSITLGETELESDNDEILSAILKGKAVLFVDGYSEVIVLSTDKYKERALDEPPTSSVLKGPRAGFVENLKTNLAVIRKILASTDLRTINLKVGKHTQTLITLLYLDGVADNAVVDKIKTRIEQIDIDGILDSNYIAAFLEENKNSMFKQVGSSEKPDLVASKVLEGRVAIIVDGSPLVLTLPFIYVEELQSGEDYYSCSARASFIRALRFISIFISLLTPALYIAVVLHHYKAIPLKFLITIVNTTKGLPLSPFAEILFVLILFEILYEASLRMPKYLGLALSIVGALILGDTAVKAGLISPPSVMIVAISGLTIYCVPEQAPQLYILRMLFTLAGAMLGFFGITVMLIFIITYLCDFDSYGSAYFGPLAPHIQEDTGDFIYKQDLTQNKTRPKSIANNKRNRTRQGKN